MIRCDALVVGGGPGGSTCARILRQAGWSVVVADRAKFPRDKVCAGWLTPDVFRLLELDPREDRATGHTFQEITGFRTGIIGGALVDTLYPRVVSYAIRRCELDDFLLRRSGARVLDACPIEAIRRHGDSWIVNDKIETPLVIGAGGHFCPVARFLRGGADTAAPVVAKEAEFRRPADTRPSTDGNPELFFCRDLDGYGWCVPKGDYINVGIGRRNARDFARHVRDFIAFLETRQIIRPSSVLRWKGHAYLASGVGPRPVVGAGMLLVGDAAGLAYPESGEGIKPAIESGRLAADTLIAASGRYDVAALQTYADALHERHAPTRSAPTILRPAVAAVGRLLLGSAAFTRHVVLDRWFLRA